MWCNPLPDDKILDWSKLEQIADNKSKVYFKCKISAIQGRKHCEKIRNWLLQAISPFLTVFSAVIYLQCVKMLHCMVMGYSISINISKSHISLSQNQMS